MSIGYISKISVTQPNKYSIQLCNNTMRYVSFMSRFIPTPPSAILEALERKDTPLDWQYIKSIWKKLQNAQPSLKNELHFAYMENVDSTLNQKRSYSWNTSSRGGRNLQRAFPNRRQYSLKNVFNRLFGGKKTKKREKGVGSVAVEEMEVIYCDPPDPTKRKTLMKGPKADMTPCKRPQYPRTMKVSCSDSKDECSLPPTPPCPSPPIVPYCFKKVCVKSYFGYCMKYELQRMPLPNDQNQCINDDLSVECIDETIVCRQPKGVAKKRRDICDQPETDVCPKRPTKVIKFGDLHTTPTRPRPVSEPKPCPMAGPDPCKDLAPCEQIEIYQGKEYPWEDFEPCAADKLEPLEASPDPCADKLDPWKKHKAFVDLDVKSGAKPNPCPKPKPKDKDPCSEIDPCEKPERNVLNVIAKPSPCPTLDPSPKPQPCPKPSSLAKQDACVKPEPSKSVDVAIKATPCPESDPCPKSDPSAVSDPCPKENPLDDIDPCAKPVEVSIEPDIEIDPCVPPPQKVALPRLKRPKKVSDVVFDPSNARPCEKVAFYCPDEPVYGPKFPKKGTSPLDAINPCKPNSCKPKQKPEKRSSSTSSPCDPDPPCDNTGDEVDHCANPNPYARYIPSTCPESPFHSPTAKNKKRQKKVGDDNEGPSECCASDPYSRFAPCNCPESPFYSPDGGKKGDKGCSGGGKCGKKSMSSWAGARAFAQELALVEWTRETDRANSLCGAKKLTPRRAFIHKRTRSCLISARSSSATPTAPNSSDGQKPNTPITDNHPYRCVSTTPTDTPKNSNELKGVQTNIDSNEILHNLTLPYPKTAYEASTTLAALPPITPSNEHKCTQKITDANKTLHNRTLPDLRSALKISATPSGLPPITPGNEFKCALKSGDAKTSPPPNSACEALATPTGLPLTTPSAELDYANKILDHYERKDPDAKSEHKDPLRRVEQKDPTTAEQKSDPTAAKINPLDDPFTGVAMFAKKKRRRRQRRQRRGCDPSCPLVCHTPDPCVTAQEIEKARNAKPECPKKPKKTVCKPPQKSTPRSKSCPPPEKVCHHDPTPPCQGELEFAPCSGKRGRVCRRIRPKSAPPPDTFECKICKRFQTYEDPNPKRKLPSCTAKKCSKRKKCRVRVPPNCCIPKSRSELCPNCPKCPKPKKARQICNERRPKPKDKIKQIAPCTGSPCKQKPCGERPKKEKKCKMVKPKRKKSPPPPPPCYEFNPLHENEKPCPPRDKKTKPCRKEKPLRAREKSKHTPYMPKPNANIFEHSKHSEWTAVEIRKGKLKDELCTALKKRDMPVDIDEGYRRALEKPPMSTLRRKHATPRLDKELPKPLESKKGLTDNVTGLLNSVKEAFSKGSKGCYHTLVGYIASGGGQNEDNRTRTTKS